MKHSSINFDVPLSSGWEKFAKSRSLGCLEETWKKRWKGYEFRDNNWETLRPKWITKRYFTKS